LSVLPQFLACVGEGPAVAALSDVPARIMTINSWRRAPNIHLFLAISLHLALFRTQHDDLLPPASFICLLLWALRHHVVV
jgi:hypothetical protein